jgi:effector-binding domain-containing protein
MFSAIAQWITTKRLPFGIPMTFYHNEGYTREDIDTECAIPILGKKGASITQPTHPIVIRQTAAVPAMATTVVGNWQAEGLVPAYNAIGQWLEDHHYHIAGSPRELYHGDPQKGDYTAEIQFPVEKERV